LLKNCRTLTNFSSIEKIAEEKKILLWRCGDCVEVEVVKERKDL
jgi:hypothetical protein